MRARAVVVFRGRVQGVYFRANCADKAEELGLDGYVRNMHDGTVEAVFEGDKSLIETCIDWNRKSQPYAREEEPGLALERLHDGVFLCENRMNEPVRVLRPSQRCRMVLDDPLRIEPRIRRNPGKSRKRLACGVFGVQDDGAIKLFRTGHGISEEFVARRHDFGVDGKVGPSDLTEGNRPLLRDVGGREVNPLPHRVHRWGGSEALPKMEIVHRVRSKGHEHL